MHIFVALFHQSYFEYQVIPSAKIAIYAVGNTAFLQMMIRDLFILFPIGFLSLLSIHLFVMALVEMLPISPMKRFQIILTGMVRVEILIIQGLVFTEILVSPVSGISFTKPITSLLILKGTTGTLRTWRLNTRTGINISSNLVFSVTSNRIRTLGIG